MRKLRLGGEIVVSAHKREGGKRYVEFLKSLSDEVQIISKSRGYRVVKAVKDREIESRKVFELYQWEEEIRGEKCSFSAVPGLFSPREIDSGSRKLVEEMDIKEGERVMDLACGYGIIGIYALKLADCDVFFTDENALATAYTDKNLSRNSLDAEVRTADALEGIEPESFDKVLSNPPTHAGQRVIDEFFENTFDNLKEGGSFYLVYNDVLDYEKQLESLFSHVNVLEDSDGFKVTRATK